MQIYLCRPRLRDRELTGITRWDEEKLYKYRRGLMSEQYKLVFYRKQNEINKSWPKY